MAQLTVSIDLAFYAVALIRAIEGHVADMKTGLRAIEDGSFVERARSQRPSAVIKFAATEREGALAGAAQRLARTCFKSVISDLIQFLDQMVGLRRLLIKGLIPPAGKPLVGEAEILEHVRRVTERQIAEVARNRALRVPDKIAELRLPSGVDELQAFVKVRNCLEHQHGVPTQELTMWVRLIQFQLGDREVTALPMQGREGEGLSVRIVKHTRVFRANEPIVLTEADIENTVFTIRLLADEITKAIDAQRAAARLAAD
jgi:hypothetical protein